MPKRELIEFRIIHHLSFPGGDSLNDELHDALCSVSYLTFEGAIVKIRFFGTGTLLAKVYIKTAFGLLQSPHRLLILYVFILRNVIFLISVSRWVARCLALILRPSQRFYSGNFVANQV